MVQLRFFRCSLFLPKCLWKSLLKQSWSGLLLVWWLGCSFFSVASVMRAAFDFTGNFGCLLFWVYRQNVRFCSEKCHVCDLLCEVFFCLTVNTGNIKIYIWILTQIQESSIFLLTDVTGVKDSFKNLHLAILNINNLFRKIIFVQSLWMMLFQDRPSTATALKRVT